VSQRPCWINYTFIFIALILNIKGKLKALLDKSKMFSLTARQVYKFVTTLTHYSFYVLFLFRQEDEKADSGEDRFYMVSDEEIQRSISVSEETEQPMPIDPK